MQTKNTADSHSWLSGRPINAIKGGPWDPQGVTPLNAIKKYR